MNKFTGRLKIIQFIFLGYMLIILGTLFYFQVFKGSEFSKKIKVQSEVREILTAQRGMVVDRKGRVLARTIKKKTEVKVDLEHSKDSVVNINRYYPFGATGSHIIGYIGVDGHGLSGIEFYFNSLLHGEPGWAIKDKDGKNERYAKLVNKGKLSIDGSDVHLTIDIKIQEILEKVLLETLNEFSAKSAMGVVMNPNTGEILAIANVPTYNLNYWWIYKGVNRKSLPISFNYEPGSTFKAVTLAAAINENLYSEIDTINANKGRFEIYDEVITDHAAFEKLSLEECVAYSSNVAFAKIADSLGKEKMYQYVTDFGFGSKTGVSLAAEESGILHDIRKWSGRTAVTMAFGHEISSTLLQMMQAYSAIINGGYLIKPRIFNSVVGHAGKEVSKNEREVIRQVITEETSYRVRKLLNSVVTYGTAKKVDFGIAPWAGKTGTSEKIDPETGRYSKSKVWASFIGFTPVENPVLLCGIVVDEPANGDAGGTAAAPAVAKVLKKIALAPESDYGLYNIKNEEIAKKKDIVKKYPNLVSLTRKEVVRFCKNSKTPYEFIGEGEVVDHQSPKAGSAIVSSENVLLYTNIKNKEGKDVGSIVVPNCINRTIKESINAFSIRNIKPHFVGRGVVIAQSPMAGSIITPTVPCTLFCEVKEYEM